MADFTITITNSLNLFGGSPSSKWNAYAWNAFRWGEGTVDLQVDVIKVITNTLDLTDALTKQSGKIISETLSVTSETTSEELSDEAGYEYVFPGGVTNADSRVSTSWTEQTYSSSWTTSAGTSTSWT